MQKIKIITLILISIMLINMSLSLPEIVKADSGFDSSYDRDSSSRSDSSWSNSSSSWSSSDSKYDSKSESKYDSDSDSDIDNNTGNQSENGIEIDLDNKEIKKFKSILFVAYFILFIFLMIIILKKIIYDIIKSLNNLTNKINANNHSLSKSNRNKRYKQMFPNIFEPKFLTDRYNDFIEIQKGWMNFDYEKLSPLLTDELYNQYEMQLETLKIKNQQNIMSDFKLKDIQLSHIKIKNNTLIIKIYLVVEFYDYIEENKKVVRGNNKRKIRMYYNIYFVSKLNNQENKCPACGAPIEDQNRGRCEYCRLVLTKETTEWVMSKKEVIKQKNL